MRRGIDRRRDGSYRVRLPSEERDILAALPAQLREALDAGEPTLYRLFPPAFVDDDESNVEYARLVGAGLLEGKLAALARARAHGPRGVADRGRAPHLARRHSKACDSSSGRSST